MTKVLILPIVTMLTALFSKIYIDTMFMPPSNKFKYIIKFVNPLSQILHAY